MRGVFAALIFAALAVSGAHAETGIASVYSGKPWEGGSKAANGERINPRAMTAAHRTLPFGTRAKVTNLRNSRSVIVRINDRGPFKRGRIIDLTPAAASSIGSDGLVPVRISRNSTRE